MSHVPIVMLHGWGMRPAALDTLAAILSPRYSVRALPLPGYDGAPLVSPYDVDSLVADIAERAPAKCSVAGWSLGAQIALAWARARPDQVERLVLLSATPCFVQREDWPSAMPVPVFDAFSDSVRGDAKAALRRFVLLQVQDDAHAPRVARALRAVLAGGPTPDAYALEGGLRILRESDMRGALGVIETRTLVLHGERDRLALPEVAEYLANALPQATLALVPGAAHAPFVSDPQAVARRMLEFLDAR